MKTRKGFTLIELLVVIAVIGILAGIVLVSVRQAPGKAKDTRIKSAITQVRDIAQLLYIDDGNYNAVCNGTALGTATDLATLAQDITDNGGTVTCHAATSSYCVYATLNTDATKTFCVDSAGVAKEYSTTSDCTGTDDFTCESD
ncbi:MAG: type II secretion system protein [Candidatus Pacebacteria bacterium]|nr:type II secretion system protein [Candidatus Paceibacterota bacterium]